MQNSKMMKVVFVAIALAWLGGFQVATATTPNRLVLNPQIGLNGATLSNEPQDIEFQAKVGWQVGGYIRYGNRIYIQPGVFWHHQNIKATQDVNSINDFDFEQQINTIQVPLCIGYDLLYSDAFVLRLFGGGVVSFLTSVDENNYIDEDDVNSTQWLGRVGLGVDFLKFTADLGYDFGFSRFYSDEAIADADTSNVDLTDVKTKELYLSFGLKF